MNLRNYEYSMIPRDEYELLFTEADNIIFYAAKKYNIDKTEVRYDNTINFLLSAFPKLNSFCYSAKSNPASLFMFNTLLSEDLNLNIKCQYNLNESEPFVNIVGGFTTFTEVGPILFLNASPNQVYQHIIFTIAHELIHIYKAKTDEEYYHAAALINRNKAIGSSYPVELQPIEDQTNVLSSLIYVPNSSLDINILNNDFNELCLIYKMSKSAMHNRLFNYFYYERGFTYEFSKKAVFSFRNCNSLEIGMIRDTISNTYSNLFSLPF